MEITYNVSRRQRPIQLMGRYEPINFTPGYQEITATIREATSDYVGEINNETTRASMQDRIRDVISRAELNGFPTGIEWTPDSIQTDLHGNTTITINGSTLSSLYHQSDDSIMTVDPVPFIPLSSVVESEEIEKLKDEISQLKEEINYLKMLYQEN